MFVIQKIIHEKHIDNFLSENISFEFEYFLKLTFDIERLAKPLNKTLNVIVQMGHT